MLKIHKVSCFCFIIQQIFRVCNGSMVRIYRKFTIENQRISPIVQENNEVFSHGKQVMNRVDKIGKIPKKFLGKSCFSSSKTIDKGVTNDYN